MDAALEDDQGGRAAALAEEESESDGSHRRTPTSTSKTPRRSNTNPQSSSPPRKREENGSNKHKNDVTIYHTIAGDDDEDEKEQPPTPSSFPSPLATPLGTLTSLLQHSHNYKQSTLQLFRTSHSLHLHAIDRKKKATEALRVAQAELEHATTAEEFALQELRRAKIDKDDANNQYVALQTDVSKLATQYKGLRVVLVNLQNNSNWNGRCGTIVKMITEGAEDIGRWKVKLDSDWRGKEPDGNYSPFEGGPPQMLSQDRHHVMAKAENLELIECKNNHGGLPSFFGGGGRSQGQEVDDDGAKSSSDDKSRAKSRSSSVSPSLIDEAKKGKHHPLDPVEELPEAHIVTPERRGGRRRIYSKNNNQPPSPPHGTEYDWKRNALGSQHSPPGYYDEPGNHFVRHHVPMMLHPHPQNRQQPQPQQKRLQRIHIHQQPHLSQMQQQHHYSSPTPKRSPKSPSIMQQHMYDRNRVSSSFSEMVSPERFEPVSFQIETSESFSQRNVLLPDSSFFEEDSPREDAQNIPYHQHHIYQEESNEKRIDSGHSSQAPSAHSNSLPTVVVLPIDTVEEEMDRDGPPTCVIVQNAGISHVNGVYVLALNNNQDKASKQPNNNATTTNDADAPPLYFRDGEPTLLSDGRYYDMCILRIDCPESPDFVIWFLSRVNIDPDCLDVKFSDCYYYCRVLRSRGWRVPPTNGWNIPDVQPGAAAAFSTADEASSSMKSGHHSQEDQAQLHSSMNSGLGIVPRAAETDYI